MSFSSAAGEPTRDALRRRRQMRRGRFLKFRRAINHDYATVALSAVMALLLVYLAVPRLAAEMMGIGSLPILERLHLGKSINERDLAQAAEELDAAISVDASEARRLTDRGMIFLLEADHQGLDTEAGKASLQAGMKALEEGLARSPANSFAWARLAAARLERDGGPSPGALKALRMSYLTGPYADGIMVFRAGLSLRLWERLDAEMSGYASKELIYLWGRSWDDQKQIMDGVCRYGRAFVLAQALRPSSAGTAEFDRLYPYFMTPSACKERSIP